MSFYNFIEAWLCIVCDGAKAQKKKFIVFLEPAIWERRRMMLPASGYSISRLEQIGI
jgi:hypothetical protein